jgi:adenine-specific DNA glycosylase
MAPAAAPAEEVLRHWNGLGRYRRGMRCTWRRGW